MEPFQFNDALKHFFKATSGAGSVITEKDEARKSQITITKYENEIISSHFPDIPKGSKTELIQKGMQVDAKFHLYPTGEEIELVLLHPKPARTELRIYMKAGVFKPAAGLIWFVFKRDDVIWIGALDEASMRKVMDGISQPTNQEALIDLSDDDFQSSFQNLEVPETIEQTISRIKRNPKIARDALKKSGYSCEILPEFPTFKSQSSGRPYLEAHHLIPISIQPKFEISLDVAVNICILNPYAHKMVHHAVYSDIENHIIKLAEPRKKFLRSLNLEVDDVLKIYGKP